MDQRGLKFIAALLTTGIFVVPFMGLDDLPRGLRTRIDSERQALATAHERVRHARDEAGTDLSAAIPHWSERLGGIDAGLRTADQDMATLAALYKANRRQDRANAEKLLAHEVAARAPATAGADSLENEAHRLADLKKRMPELLGQMERDYESVKGASLAGATSAVDKAGKDWPEKKTDLDSRLAALRSISASAEKTWTDSEPQRKKAAARDWAGIDVGAFVSAADTLHNDATSLASQSVSLQGLTDQLYVSWDKVLVDLDRRGHEYRERLRTVRTRDGKVASDEQWVNVSRAEFQSVEKNLGMTIAHKGTGKYDSEAERVAQPAGFAYMAPPGQSNTYGHWESHGGQSFWVWYGQYALLRDLLFNHSYRPIERGDWESYRDARRGGNTYYGRTEDNHPRYGTSAPETQSSYAGSKYAQGGGFRDSKYAAKGGFGGSKYEQPSSPPRTFGSSRPAERPRYSAPRSSPRPSGGGGGRTFGRRR